MLHEKKIILDSRLFAIAEMVGKCDRYADIGCDHGRLGAFLLQRGWVSQALLMDISDPSLDKARALIRLLGLEEKTRFLVGDGADPLDCPIDCVVIAGMGGTTAAGIIERGKGKFGGAKLIIQANVANPELRERLMHTGYQITDERVVKDGRRHYIIIEAVPGHAEYDERELMVGPVLLREKPAELAGYVEFRLRVARKALLGAERGGEVEIVDALRREIQIWEDVQTCL